MVGGGGKEWKNPGSSRTCSPTAPAALGLTQKMKLKTKSRYLMHLVQPSTPMAASAAAAPGLRPSWAVAGRERKGRPLPPPPEGRGPSKAKVFLFPFPVLLCPSGSLPTPRTFFPTCSSTQTHPHLPKRSPPNCAEALTVLALLLSSPIWGYFRAHHPRDLCHTC